MKLKAMLVTLLTCLWLFSAVIPSHATDYWAIYKQATTAMKANQYAQATPLLEKTEKWFLASKNNVNIAMFYNNLGRCYAQTKKYDKATAAWKNESLYWKKVGKLQEQIAAERKADMIRQDIRLFSKKEVEKTGPSALYAPKTGTLLGIYAENDPALNQNNADYALHTEEVLGKKHAGFLLYYTYGKDFSNLSVHVKNAKKSNAFLMLGVQPLNGLDSIKDDAYLTEFAKDIASFDMPVFIRFANEMNDPTNKFWYDKDPKKYIDKFRLVANKIHALAPNAVMVWAPAYYPPDNISAYYPGDAYVDWVGVSIYRQYHPELDPLEKGVDRFSYLDHFSNIYKLYGNKKSIMVAEGAVSYTDYKTGKNISSFATRELQNYLAYMPILYPNLKAMFYFDTSTGKGTSYRLSDNAELLATYQKGIASPSYLSAIGDTSGFSYFELKSEISITENHLYAFVKVPDNDCISVTYSINGKVVSEVKSVPFDTSLDLHPYLNQKITVVVKGYNKSKQCVVSKTFTLTVKP